MEDKNAAFGSYTDKELNRNFMIRGSFDFSSFCGRFFADSVFASTFFARFWDGFRFLRFFLDLFFFQRIFVFDLVADPTSAVRGSA